MTKSNCFLIFLFVLILGSGCVIDIDDDSFNDDDNFGGNCIAGDGDRVSEILSINEFKGIKLKIEADVFITQGSEQQVEILAQQNVIDQIERDVSNDTWEIEYDDCIRNEDRVEIFITMDIIELLSVSGSGFIRGENIFEVEDLDLKILGSGDIDVAANAESIDGDISGSGKMILEGTTNEFDFEISGSGDYRAFELSAQKGDIEVTGSGDSEVRVADDLDIEINGSGDVYYKGNPSLDIEVNGSGRVVDAN